MWVKGFVLILATRCIFLYIYIYILFSVDKVQLKLKREISKCNYIHQGSQQISNLLIPTKMQSIPWYINSAKFSVLSHKGFYAIHQMPHPKVTKHHIQLNRTAFKYVFLWLRI